MFAHLGPGRVCPGHGFQGDRGIDFKEAEIINTITEHGFGFELGAVFEYDENTRRVGNGVGVGDDQPQGVYDDSRAAAFKGSKAARTHDFGVNSLDFNYGIPYFLDAVDQGVFR